MEKRIEKDGQIFDVKVNYTKGGTNWATGRDEVRGYYLRVQPIEVEELGNGLVSVKQLAFSGVKSLLIEVSRRSDKQYERACGMVTDGLINSLIGQCNY